MSLGYLGRVSGLGFSFGDQQPTTQAGDLSTSSVMLADDGGVSSAFSDDTPAKSPGIGDNLLSFAKGLFAPAVPRPASANVASSGTSYTPWLIGGGILAAVLLLSRKKKA
jgi:hypothetical protein